MVYDELNNLRHCDHENIIKYFESFADVNSIHIVTEYCKGGELLTHL